VLAKRSVIVWFVLTTLVCSVSVVVVGFSIARVYRWFNPYLDQQLAGPTTISAQWLEITPKSPLKISRQRHLIVLHLDDSIRTEADGAGLILPDGSVVRPQVELVSTDGKTYELNQPSLLSSPTETLAYFTGENLPKDQVYVTVRIRTDKPVRCKRIFWRNYNIWDAEA
jgi:hypothetical protein